MNNIARIVIGLVLAIAAPASAREQIRIVGSSSVFPFVAAAAEQFGRATQFRTPIIESNGTGGGFKMFCDGVGDRYPDIANASRPIKASETERCRDHGVTGIAEFKIGYDGIVIANAISDKEYRLTKKMIFLALARQVPQNGVLVANPYTRWNQVDPQLPDEPIEVYGPPPAEGTRDAFVEMVMQQGCTELPEHALYATPAACGAIREDGRFMELLGGNVMVQKLVNNHHALGIFSYSFLDQNRALVKANPVEGALPTVDSIVSGDYRVARSLYMYVKAAHLKTVPGMAEFMRFVMSDTSVGADGFLSVKGLIPLSAADRKEMQVRAENLH